MRVLHSMIIATALVCRVCGEADAAMIAATNLGHVPAVFENVGLLKPNGVQAIGQSFTSHRSGLLSSIDTFVAAGWDNPTTQALEVSLYSAVSGLPETYLGGRSFQAREFNQGGADLRHLLFESLDMSQEGTNLIRGESYIVVFETFPGVGSAQSAEAPYHIGAYPGIGVAAGPLGTNFARSDNGSEWEVLPVSWQWELALSVRVVPESSISRLAVLGTVTLLATRLRSTQSGPIKQRLSKATSM